jgi:hypothetical protein
MRRIRWSLVSCLLIAVAVACATTGGSNSSSSAPSAGSKKSSSDYITSAEIESGTYRDAYDIVQQLRPAWLNKAQSPGGLSGMSVSGGTGVQSSGNAAGLVVYLDNTRMGGPASLRDISAPSIRSLQYMDGATATAKLPGLGSSIVAGAIVVTSRSGR